jgi:hypothetical protein
MQLELTEFLLNSSIFGIFLHPFFILEIPLGKFPPRKHLGEQSSIPYTIKILQILQAHLENESQNSCIN